MKGKFLTFILAITACITIPCGLFLAGCSNEPTHDHAYGEVSYVWEQDDTVCVATRVCTKDQSHVQTERVSATLVSTESQPTYLLEGAGTMQATFSNRAFETQTKSVVLPKKNAIVSFEGAQVDGNQIIYVVPAETTSVNFTDIITVQEDCSFTVLDTYNDPIENNDTSNLWELYQGNNSGYKLRITSLGDEQITYNLTIHRIHEITIYYYDQTRGIEVYRENIMSAQEYVPNEEYVNNVPGYTFNRFVDRNFNDYQVATLYENTHVYVDRSANVYTVTFDENAGNMAGTTAQIYYNSVPYFDRPERPGCNFLGWSVNDVQITNRYGQGYNSLKWNIPNDQVVVALWEYNVYNIDYRLDGGKNDSSNITSYHAYDSQPFGLYEPTKDDTFIVNSYKTAVLEAQDGSNEKLVGVDYYTNSKIRVNKTTTKYIFDGWYTDENFENQVTYLEFTYGAIVLYAKWIEQTPVEEVADVDWLVVNEDGTYNPNGAYLLMGTYPQTIKSADVTIDTSLNGSNGWNVGSDGNLYKAINASPYVSQVSSTTYYFSDNTRIVKNQTYYFKLEPMRWRILSRPNANGALASLMADKAIDTNIYDLQKESVYETSFLREFFLTNFYEMHFSQSTKDVMSTKTFYNDVASTKEFGIYYPDGFEDVWDNNPYVGGTLNDKIYAFSARDLTSSVFSTYFTTKDAKRTVKPTDYALAKGAAARTVNDEYKGNVSWWTRSPYPQFNANSSPAVMTVSWDGSLAMEDGESYAFGLTSPYVSGLGIVPSIKLQIPSF